MFPFLFLGNRTSTSYWEEEKKRKKGEIKQNERRIRKKELGKNGLKKKKIDKARYKK